MTQKVAHRNGLTLYEVVLALAILLGALAVLGQIISTGTRAAVQARLETQALLYCQTKLSEVVAGIEPLQIVNGAAIEDAPSNENWTWSLEYAAGPHADLIEFEVSVSHLNSANQMDVKRSLSRYMRNPQIYVKAADQAAELEAAAAEESQE